MDPETSFRRRRRAVALSLCRALKATEEAYSGEVGPGMSMGGYLWRRRREYNGCEEGGGLTVEGYLSVAYLSVASLRGCLNCFIKMYPSTVVGGLSGRCQQVMGNGR
jgi:hypothetical protein